jgi:hypothetical protein
MHDGEKMCYAQAIIVSYFGLASVLCTVAIAWTLFSAIILQKPNVEESFWRMMAFAYGLPIIGTVIPIFSGSYGETIGFCWVTQETPTDSMIGFV